MTPTVGRDEEQYLGGIDCHAYLEFDGENIEPKEKKYEVSVQIEGEQDSVIKEADIDPDNARKMTLDLSQWIRENQTHKGKTFTVTYYAKVNADAVVQTNNSAHLEYGNDPDNITTTTAAILTEYAPIPRTSELNA